MDAAKLSGDSVDIPLLGSTGGTLRFELMLAGGESLESRDDPFVPLSDAGRFTRVELKEVDRPANPLSLAALGIVLVPDVVTRTPPYVDRVVPNSPAAAAGLRPDDLLVMVDSQVASSCRQAVQ